jgi:hypothetical protein
MRDPSCGTRVSMVVRFRRSRGVERQQLKWFTYAGALLVLSLLVGDYLFPNVEVVAALFALAVAFVPIAAGIAILRYRLYDIDRLINRTLVYGSLTVILGLGYAAVVLVLGHVFGGVAGNPPSGAVAGATLAMAALFQPARRASRRWWTGALTGASTTRPGSSRRSARDSGTSSTWTRCRPSCWRWSTRRCSRPRHRCGSGLPQSRSATPRPNQPALEGDSGSRGRAADLHEQAPCQAAHGQQPQSATTIADLQGPEHGCSGAAVPSACHIRRTSSAPRGQPRSTPRRR